MPSDSAWAANERPRARSSAHQTANETSASAAAATVTRRERGQRLGEVEPAEPAPERDDEQPDAGDVGERDRERDAPRPDGVEREVERRVQDDDCERDRTSASTAAAG